MCHNHKYLISLLAVKPAVLTSDGDIIGNHVIRRAFAFWHLCHTIFAKPEKACSPKLAHVCAPTSQSSARDDPLVLVVAAHFEGHAAHIGREIRAVFAVYSPSVVAFVI